MLRARMRLLGALFLIVLHFGLDVRDLYFKLHLLGPYNTHSFTTVEYDTIASTPISRPSEAIDSLRHGKATAASGWPSFYSRCESMRASGATGTSRFFHTTLAQNCTVGDISANTTRIVPHLLMTASIRLDSMVWVACQLLFMTRRPPVCSDTIATGFKERYMFKSQQVLFHEMAQPGSAKEDKLLRFLDMVSYSFPFNRITCVEAVEIGEGATGEFQASMFGCASPNLYRSEWIGISHKAVAKYLVNMGWLTVDVIALVGNRYGIRLNAVNSYGVSYATSTGQMAVKSSSLVNFSSFGHLYVLSVLIDILLLVAHIVSALEVIKWLTVAENVDLHAWIMDFEETSCDQIVPPRSVQREGKYVVSAGTDSKTRNSAKLAESLTESVAFDEAQFYSFFSQSLYHSAYFVVLLTTVAQLLSWIIIVPNSLIWAKSDSACPTH